MKQIILGAASMLLFLSLGLNAIFISGRIARAPQSQVQQADCSDAIVCASEQYYQEARK